MNTLLLEIKLMGLRVGQWRIYTNRAGGMAARHDKTGLISPDQKPTVAGLTRLLKWIDAENYKPTRPTMMCFL